MGRYNFKHDLLAAKLEEKEVADLLVAKVAAWQDFRIVMSEGKNAAYDFSLIPPPVHVEVKSDYMAQKTGNVAVEVECRGKPSGLNVTEANWWVYRIHTEEDVINVLIDPSQLLMAIDLDDTNPCPKLRMVEGGDNGSRTKMWLFPMSYFISLGEVIKG